MERRAHAYRRALALWCVVQLERNRCGTLKSALGDALRYNNV